MKLEDLQVVLKIATCGSITAAANSLDMQIATASAALKRVEKKVGTRLFIRTTRQLTLSRAGERYIPKCRAALEILKEAHHDVVNELDSIEGDIRVSVSSDLGRNFIVPWVDEFMQEYPKVTVQLNINDGVVDFFRSSSTIALRYGKPQDSNLYGFKLCDVPSLLCASPSYLKNVKPPKHPTELIEHDALFYELHELTHDTWEFSNNNKRFKVTPKNSRRANDGDVVRRWCLAGKGIAKKSCLDISSDLLEGRLLSVMPDFKPLPTELWLICSSSDTITPTVRCLREMMRDKCANILSDLRQEGFI